MEPLAPPLPTFLIIGAQKSATRWLRLNLGLHPAVFTSARRSSSSTTARDTGKQGTDWYRAQFAGWAGEAIVGEATPGYMFWRHRPAVVSERIQETLPDVRLIATLRNPIDRAQSAMVHHMEYGTLPPDSVLIELVKTTEPERDRLGIISGGWYAASLEPYMERFGDRLLVVLHDDVDDDARRRLRLRLAAPRRRHRLRASRLRPGPLQPPTAGFDGAGSPAPDARRAARALGVLRRRRRPARATARPRPVPVGSVVKRRRRASRAD